MDQLIAFPIKGESFLLRSAGRHVLVDGGYNSIDLAKALADHVPDLKKIDIVVCTHADRDHSGGLTQIIDAWGHTVGEFWLPGSWVDVLPDLCKSERFFIDGLVAELDELTDEQQELAKLDADQEQIASAYYKLVAHHRRDESVPHRQTQIRDDENEDEKVDESELRADERYRDPDWFAELRHAMEETADSKLAAKRAFDSARSRVRYRQTRGRIGKEVALYWLGLIDTAENIRAIAKQAIKHAVPVRWFDFHEFARTRRARGGIPNFLEPLNAVEQAPRLRLGLNFIARLSPVNEECLAFIAPPRWRRIGVVFCGDSPLGDGYKYGTSFLEPRRQPKWPVIATAPHHGSEHNGAAYAHLRAWATVILWVRTGGSVKQPGATFKSLHMDERLCTHCPQSSLMSQRATITLMRRYPIVRVSGHQCSCK